MRKLYAFLVTLLILGSTLFKSDAQAQSYTMASYLVRAIANNWTPITGTQMPEMLAGGSNYNYYYTSLPVTVPFTFRMGAVSGLSRVISGSCGELICGTTWPGQMYNYSGYNGSYEFQSYEVNYGSYGYYPNNIISPWTGSLQLMSPSTIYQYTTVGSAPNRVFIMQVNDKMPYQYGGTVPTASWQAWINESGISSFEFHYGPQSNTALNWTYNGQGYTFYPVVVGLKGQGGWSGYSNMVCTIQTRPEPAIGSAPPGIYYNGNPPDQQTYAVPTVGYKFFIAFPYDYSADAITNPVDQSIKLKDVALTPTVRVTNQGSSVPASATVSNQMTLLGGSVPSYAQSVTVAGITSFTSGTVTFPDFTPTSYGIYEDTAIVTSLSPTNDQLFSNNTITAEFTVSPPNNIKAITVLNPAPKTRTPINVNTPIGVRFKNIGANGQSNVPVSAYVTDPLGNVVYRDTAIIRTWPSGKIYDTTFKDWIPSMNGDHKVCGVALLSTDQLVADDTTCGIAGVRYESDVAGISVYNPQPDEEKPYTKVWKPTGVFQSVGVSDLFDVPVRVQIKRCTDNALVFQADSTMPELNVDQNQVKFGFPSKQGNFDVTKLVPGCYNMCVIAKYPTDGDRTNDTACTSFSIIDRLKGDINVGVGQRFQTLHAAVDSLKFRGVGGNVRLIMTDANYTENGSDVIASTPNGFLDFTGISGVADTARITFMPKPGVSPTVTFSGNRPSCFYFGYKSPNWVKFDGQNEIGIPTPDKNVPDANKRGLTIINNSTKAGSIFALEFGAHHMSLRNMKLVNNGNFSNDSSAVIRFYHDQNQTIYLNGVRDTLPVHDVVIENNAMGNAKYGVWDRGVHDLFNIGPPTLFMPHRNYNNTISRNSIGSSTNQIGYAGISFDNTENYTIQRNEIAWVNSSLSGQSNAYGIAQSGVGNATGMWIDGNKIHNVSASTTAYGVAMQQAATIYTNGTGVNQQKSTLPLLTRNRTTNNSIYDLRSASTYPVVYLTYANNYFTSNDSIFNNSITVSKAAVDVYVAQAAKAFVWNNIIQNFNAGGASYTNYYFASPRPFASNISTDFNLYDLRGNAIPFATVNEYDQKTGNFIQTRTFRRFNDWRTYTQQDAHSITADPLFASNDSLHLPGALSYVSSPASNNGAYLNTASQMRDIDGDLRFVGNQTPDIGSDEFEGFQFNNDLAVMAIYKPAGYSRISDTTFISTENPLQFQSVVKNLSSQAVFGRTVNAMLEVAISGGSYTTIWQGSTTGLTFDVNESKTLSWTGPSITAAQAQNGVFRFTTFVANDQNNANNSQQKLFKVLVKSQAVLVSYEASTTKGLQNRDSVTAALRRLGVAYDSLNRTTYGSIDLDYTPWWTLVWSQGDPNIGLNANPSLGVGGLSLKETEELTRYLNAGQTYAKKSLVIAGQNIAYYNDFGNVNSNNITDTQFTHQMLHSKFLARTPVVGGYNGTIRGGIPVYFTFNDQLIAASPNVVARTIITPSVAPEVTGVAYNYLTHPAYTADSGAGIAYYGPTKATVFFAFDWADLVQTNPSEAGLLTSGTTRALRGALDFIQSAGGTVLPVSFVNVNAQHNSAKTANVITWKTGSQKDVARFDVEQSNGADWSTVGSVMSDKFAFTHAGINAAADYSYRVVAVDLNGARTSSQTVTVAGEATTEFALEQNYPNPFNPTTVVGFTLAAPSEVTLRVLDVTGKSIMTVVSGEAMTAGHQSVTINASDLASGTYVYELVATQANGQQTVLSRKMTLNK